jgi:hypothetical protein
MSMQVKPKADAVVVPRGLSPAYYFYMEVFARTNELGFVVDRRVADRRRYGTDIAMERRATDRRGGPKILKH